MHAVFVLQVPRWQHRVQVFLGFSQQRHQHCNILVVVVGAGNTLAVRVAAVGKLRVYRVLLVVARHLFSGVQIGHGVVTV